MAFRTNPMRDSMTDFDPFTLPPGFDPFAAAEAAVATLTARLDAMDARLTERLNDQMGRLVRAVAGMLAPGRP